MGSDAVAEDEVGWCTACGGRFSYQLIHNGFNDTAYAYCDRCGATAFLSEWSSSVPVGLSVPWHEAISGAIEPYLKPCPCGGRFRAGASPRCPRCKSALSAIEASKYIEADQASGRRTDWRWQGNWTGVYSIVVESNSIEDNWVSGRVAEPEASNMRAQRTRRPRFPLGPFGGS